MSQIVTGDDTDVELTLLDAKGAVVNVSAATTIQARLVQADRLAYLTPTYTCDKLAVGANWTLGKIIVSLLGADTTALTEQLAKWEVQVVHPTTGKKTYFDIATVQVLKGWIE
jgi:hypothetical protein